MTDHDDNYGYLLDMVQRKSLVEKLAEKRKEFLKENLKLSEIAKPIHSPNDDIDYEELFNILDDISDDQDVDDQDQDEKEDKGRKDVEEKDVEEKDVDKKDAEKEDELNEDQLLEKELELELQEYKNKLYNMDEKQFNNLCVREKLLNDFFKT